MKTIHLIIGTRPEAIKMAPVLRALQTKNGCHVRLISTGQHRELLQQTLESFGLKPYRDLNVMRTGQSLSSLTANLLNGLERLFGEEKPDLILGHGDTTSCYATALSSFYHSIPFFHVEAGLRTFRLDSPFPEEFNRQCVTQMTAHHFAPSDEAKQNLLEEGVSQESISVIGSTVHDAIHLIDRGNSIQDDKFKKTLSHFKNTAVFTLHRREGGSASMGRIMGAIKQVATHHPETVFVFPVHPNPKVKELAYSIFSSQQNILLTDPLDYPSFLKLLSTSSLVLTDSGGVQEEAAYFGKQTLILRDITERKDGLSQKTSEIIGTDPDKIVSRISDALSKPLASPRKLQDLTSASQIIADFVEERCLA